MTDGFYDDGAPNAAGRRDGVQRLINLAGLAMSVALVIGMSVWGYRLLVRDVQGVPVVQALEGTFRSQPDDPGGMTTPHQGLQVNEIAGDGAAGGPADEVTLAPAPESFAEEDAPMGELASTAPADEPVQPSSQESDAPGEEALIGAENAPVEITPANDDAQAAESDGPVENEPDDTAATDRAVAEALSAGETAPEAPQTSVAYAAPRPAPRPTSLSDAGGGSIETAPAEAPEVTAAALPEGTRLVQLGAFLEPDVAREQWNEIGARFPGQFDGKRRVIQQAESGGQPFYRLRVEGFETLAQAQNFCSTLMARNTDCIQVEAR